MIDLPRFIARPTLRCFHPKFSGDVSPCGAPAVAFRLGDAWRNSGYLCAAHAAPSDFPIPSIVVFRRVRIMAHVDLAGASMLPSIAQAEAVRQLETAIAAVGGILNLVDVSSTVGQHIGGNAVGVITASVGQG